MSDRDNITLPREVAEHLTKMLEECPLLPNKDWSERDCAALTALRTALAAPRPEPVAHSVVAGALFDFMGWLTSRRERLVLSSVDNSAPAADAIKDFAEMRGLSMSDAQVKEWQYNIAPPAAAPEPVRHPGYVIGNHWLETAYERLCAGEAEDAILEDYELVREPRLRDLRRDAERYWWLLNWLVKTGLLSRERCRIDSPASFGDWWILRKPKVIDGSSLIGYGETEGAAIDAAMQEDRS